MKVVRTTEKTTASTTVKTPCSTMPETIIKKLHQGTKTNCHPQNVETTKMKSNTKPVPRTSMATATATSTARATAKAEVTGIPAPEEGLRNG